MNRQLTQYNYIRFRITMAQIVQLYCKQVFTENVQLYNYERGSNIDEFIRNLDQWIQRDFGLQHFDYVDGSYSFKHPEYRMRHAEDAPKMGCNNFAELLQDREDFHVIYIRSVTLEECGVCMEDCDTSLMRINFLCTHRFCRSCVTSMANTNCRLCPLCRSPVIPRATVTIGAVA